MRAAPEWRMALSRDPSRDIAPAARCQFQLQRPRGWPLISGWAPAQGRGDTEYGETLLPKTISEPSTAPCLDPARVTKP